MEKLQLSLDIENALELHLFFRQREECLDGFAHTLAREIDAYLYRNLSIEDMEKPEVFLARISSKRYSGARLSG